MSDNLQKDSQQVIFCDMCVEEDRKPARKTCMKCEMSMCVHHLQAHLITPLLLQTHPLTEPIAAGPAALGGTTKCPQHGKLLEYYCLDDMICVCVSCAIEDQHHLHNMKTFSTAHKELRKKLSADQQALLLKTNVDSVSLEKWEKAEREKLGRSSVRLIDAVTNLRDIALTSVQSSVSARMVSIRTSKSSMEVAQREKDAFRFLQMFSQVHQDMEKAKAADLRKGLEPGNHRDKLVEEIRESGENLLAQAVKFCGSLLTVVDPENHQNDLATRSGLIFDPQTLGRGMSLSKDKRKVFYSSWLGERSAHTLCMESVQSTTDSNRWTVNLPGDCDWTIGLCDRKYAKELKDGHVYGLCSRGNQLSSLTTEYHEVSYGSRPMRQKRTVTTERRCRISRQVIMFPDENVAQLMAQPLKVEIVWNFAACSLSFFSWIGLHQRIKAFTITVGLNNRLLIPFVHLGEKKSSPRELPSCRRQIEKKWKCWCGNVYTGTDSGYVHGGSLYTFKSRCSCGGIIGALCITEVLCEIL